MCELQGRRKAFSSKETENKCTVNQEQFKKQALCMQRKRIEAYIEAPVIEATVSIFFIKQMYPKIFLLV